MDKYTREIVDESIGRNLARWKEELKKPNLSTLSRSVLEMLVRTTEADLNYTYPSVKLPYSIRVVKHKRTEPRPLVWEEEQFFFLHRWWRKFTIWLDWYMNK